MDTSPIKNLEITTKDFELLNKALDHYTTKDFGMKIMSSLMGAMMRNSPKAQAEFERQERLEEARRQRELDILKDDIRILQSKLIQLKRSLIENDLMGQIK